MSYRTILESPAKSDLAALPRPLQLVVRSELRRLAGSPVTLSRPAVFPYPPGSQLYHFHHDPGGDTWHHFVVLFRYGQDEATLHIIGIGHVEYDRET